eukprot:CAMPEP_0119327154 /NCGR_PEP_ID=MMETSP1333-20130426/70014_1 /TAXON_ID=418940 /ORGANISM="Scyphosphaera apsteinii, Strain RCC1455" /LENGTH=175 /DNA_ID=CAMNT_0007335651 /DNA_START=359 /DNA_END=886 /DNA_ORIENTATION=-
MNVNLVVELKCKYAVVTAVGVVNPADGFDNQVADVLAFGSITSPLAEHFQKYARLPHLESLSIDPEAGLQPGNRWAASADDHAERELVRQLLRSSTMRTQPGVEPLAAICFPPWPEACGRQIVHRCAPTVCRYVRFQLLRSHNPKGHTNANIDVSKLQIFGVPMTALQSLVDNCH